MAPLECHEGYRRGQAAKRRQRVDLAHGNQGQHEPRVSGVHAKEVMAAGAIASCVNNVLLTEARAI